MARKMASALITLESFSSANFPVRPKFSFPSNTFVVSTFSSPKTANYIKLKNLPRASSEGLPTELIEDSKFVPLSAEDPQYGPPALLLLGFEVEEVAKIRKLLKDLDGEFLEVIFCTEDMITRSLWEAVNTKQPNLDTVKIAKSVPQICFLSGLTGEEMMMFVDAFHDIGLEPAVFAALVPNSAEKPIQELIEEIMGDHEMMIFNFDSLQSDRARHCQVQIRDLQIMNSFSGLEPAVFAALVPNSADKQLQELIEEIMGDHEMLVNLRSP